ncbi:MAG: tetratricopeptide repeat protein [Desulfovibrio sp.]|nr:tetratricopeptide repeat protein [Desulfovibrio sp.]MBI4959480.1 tetratricopeptide repeat protein [Desulfovibrio sp.]
MALLALATAFMFFVLHVPVAEAQTLPDSVVLEGNWFTRELTRLRSFPHLDKAYRLLSQGRRTDAVAEFAQYLEIVPTDFKVQELFVNLLADEGRIDEALGRADAILKDHPGLAKLRLVRANLLSRLNRDTPAAADYELLLQDPALDQESARQALAGLAAIRLRQKRYAQALELLDAMKSGADSPVAMLLRSQALLGLGRAPEALILLERVLAGAQTPKDKTDALAVLAQGLTDMGDLDGARERLLESLRILPDTPATLRALADNAMRRKEPGQAVEYARKAQSLETTPAARELFANALIQAGRPGEAAQIFAELASSAKGPAERERQLIRQANALSLAGDDAAATEIFAQAAGGDKPVSALEGLASSLERLGRFQEAALAQRKALEASPTAQRLLRLAGLTDKAGNPGEAARILERALAGELTDEARVAASEEMGFLLDKAGKHREALEAWRTALSRRPGDAALLSRMAALSQRLGDIQGAVRYAQAARDAKPDLETTSSLAVLLALTGQTGKAADLLRQALPLAAGDTQKEADLLERLGTLEAMTGRHERAAHSFVLSYDKMPTGRAELLARAAGELLDAGRDEEARPILERLLRLPGLPLAVRAQGLARSGMLALRQGDMTLAGQTLNQALATGALPKAMRLDVLVSLATIAQRGAEPAKAVELFEQAMREGMEPWRARFAMGLALFQAKRYAQALEQFQMVKGEKPGPRVSLAMARSYEALDKPGLAIHNMREVFPKQAGLSEEEKREYYFALGNLYARTGDNNQAAEAYRQSLAVREDPAVMLRLARMERLNGNPQEALRLLRLVQAQAMPGLDLAGVRTEQVSFVEAGLNRPASAKKMGSGSPVPSAQAAPPTGPGITQASPDGQPAPALQTGRRPPAAAPPDQPSQAPDSSRAVSVVLVADDASGTMVLFKGVGSDVRPAVFALESPNRLVLDLPGKWRMQDKAVLSGPGGRVQGVRSGLHPDKLRVVLDLAGRPGDQKVENTPEGLLVRFGR